MVRGKGRGDGMSEKKISDVGTGTPSIEARVSRDTRVYEAKADYDALLQEYTRVLTRQGYRDESAALVIRAKLDIEIAKDLSANVLALRNVTERGAAEANALSRRIYWLNWTLVVLTFVLVLVGVGGIYALWWFWAHPHP